MLRISNSLSGKKEPWSPSVPGEVKIYVCGMTVYDDCHLGHARSAIVFDVIRNYLEYKGLRVRYVKNYTDVDDKIINRAQQEGRDWKAIANRFIDSYERDMVRLGVRPPTVAPKATEHIEEMVQLIDRLIAKGIAYPVEGNVYFEVERFPSYGKLSKRKLDEMDAGARVEVDQRKRSPLDFALWKASKPGEPAWRSPWGMGRPGWHIECSAMAIKHLGETIDIHGGGKDLIFPHHENEIAQSEAYTGKEFAPCWIHHGFVTIDQEKMSKSVGNFFTIKEIFEKSPQFSEEMISEIVRFYLLSTHYRSPIDFSDQSLDAAKSGLDNFYTLFQKLDEIKTQRREGDWSRFRSEFEAAMDDDFNTARAIGVLQALRSEINIRLAKGEQIDAVQAKELFQSFGKIL
ncbi:MAG: cysteine--tRNA ligase, partial [Nitrospiria bacterium]